MVVLKKFTSSEFAGLSSIQGRLLYDSTSNVLRFHDSQSYNNVLVFKDLSNNLNNINSLTATNLTGTLQTAAQPNITSVGTLTSLSTNSITLNGTAITATAAEINSLSGSTATPTQLNYINISTPGIAEASKALVLDSSRNITNINSLTSTNLTGTLQTAAQPNITSVGTLTSLSTSSLTLNGTAITATAAELNKLSGVTATTAEINYLDITTIGTGEASKVVVLDSSRNITNINNLTLTGTLTVGAVGSGPNKIHFSGTTDDATSNHTVIAERIYNSTEQSELLLFKGNDPISSTGPDRIRMRAAEFRFQTYTAAEDYSTVADTNNRLFIANDGKIGINTVSPGYTLDVSGNINLTGSLLFSGTAADLTTLTGATAGTAVASKALVLDANRNIININALTATNLTGTLQTAAQPNITSVGTLTSLSTGSLTLNGTAITATAAELNKLSGVIATTAEINYLDITTIGTAQASKALVLNASKEIKEITKLQIGTNTTIGAGDLNIMNTAANSRIRFGSSETSGNLVSMQWTYVSADSLTNKFSLDFYGRSNQMAFFNSGNMSLNRASPYAMFDIAGSSNFADGTYNKMLACFGNNASPVQFDIQCSTGSSATSTNAVWIGTITNNDLRIGTNNSSSRITITAAGYIGMGTNSPGYPLHVNNTGASYTGTFAFYALFNNTSTTTGIASNASGVCIFTNGRVLGSEFNATSDSRIKTNIIDIDGVSALNTLRLIQPKKYNYIDTLNRSSNPVWGFIAQQVHSVLDYAVNIETDYIPNIFQTATKTITENGDTILTVTNPITFDSHSTNKLKIISENDKYKYVTIKTKISNTQISINETLEDNNYFIYGEQINNLHVLNKDAIFTITTVAVQKIDRNVTELENKVVLLEQKNNQLEQQIQDILSRLHALENP